jgi:signal transduction histidine kinase
MELILGGLGPGAGAAILGSAFPIWPPLVVWVGLMLGWRRALAPIGRLLGRQRPAALPASSVPAHPAVEEAGVDGWRVRGVLVRDVVSLGLTIMSALGAMVACCDTWPLVLGVGLGGLVGLAIRGGFLGAAWKDAAIPLGCAVAIPILNAGLALGGGAVYFSSGSLLVTFGALPVAFLLAQHHPDAGWRRITNVVALGLAGIVVLTIVGFPEGRLGESGTGMAERYLLMAFITLVPSLIVAFSRSADGARVTDRLDTLVVGLTPGAAMTVLVPSFGPVLLMAWLIGLVAWRRLTIAPLLGLAQRTQRQRDLAVVAVEAERARLAADLHDDALQELSALVRRLDAAGDDEGAGMARGVAERLRTITSDLRLPVLDDLGAGPALEWLVGRVRPLAGGPVVLERVDADRPPAGVELAVFRVAQEALANAVKHGKAPITVRYRVAEDGGVSLSVDDSGPGIDTGAAEEALQAGHLGMANMQQRAEQIGALLDVRRWPAGGTHVAMEWRPR